MKRMCRILSVHHSNIIDSNFLISESRCFKDYPKKGIAILWCSFSVDLNHVFLSLMFVFLSRWCHIFSGNYVENIFLNVCMTVPIVSHLLSSVWFGNYQTLIRAVNSCTVCGIYHVTVENMIKNNKNEHFSGKWIPCLSHFYKEHILFYQRVTLFSWQMSDNISVQMATVTSGLQTHRHVIRRRLEVMYDKGTVELTCCMEWEKTCHCLEKWFDMIILTAFVCLKAFAYNQFIGQSHIYWTCPWRLFQNGV